MTEATTRKHVFGPHFAGAIVGLSSLPIHLVLGERTSHLFGAFALVFIAAIYIGFAVADGRRMIIAIEGTVASIFFICALASLLTTHWLIPIAYLLHAGWDYAHHCVDTAMPRWYIPFCAVVDIVIAAGLIIIWQP